METIYEAKDETTDETTKVKENIANQIQQYGLKVLKKQLKLSNLNKDLIRSIASSGEQVPRYSRLTKEELIDALAEKGWAR
jgi:hypothetical protein